MIYKWKPGRQISADPEKAAMVMNDLAQKGSLNAETLVEVSKPEDAPLHNEFEWDDSVAATEYRKYQARNIINAIIEVDENAEKETPVRCFFKIDSNSSNYEPLDVILQSVEKTDLLVNQAKNEFYAFQKKYDAIIKKANAEQEASQLQAKLESISA